MTEEEEQKRETVRQLLQDDRLNISGLSAKLYPHLTRKISSDTLVNKLKQNQGRNINTAEVNALAADLLDLANEITSRLPRAEEPEPIPEEPEEEPKKERTGKLTGIFSKTEKA